MGVYVWSFEHMDNYAKLTRNQNEPNVLKRMFTMAAFIALMSKTGAVERRVEFFHPIK